MVLLGSYDGANHSKDFAEDYQSLIVDRVNQNNSVNKLIVKRSLISDAIQKNKPKRQRNYSSMIEINAKTIMDLPACFPMQITMDIARQVLSI
jgi:hypothetical protein